MDGFQYAGSVLQFFPHAEGYVNATPNQASLGGGIVSYIYNYTDHLGNVRLSYSKDPLSNQLKIMEENHYYPFGLKHSVYNSDKKDFEKSEQLGIPPVITNVTKTRYDYKYNGKEYQDELGLGWYDYQARNYDPALGRWMNIDPLAEVSRRFSPYAYALNNPVFFIDPDGMLATPPDWYIDARTGKVLGQDGAATNDVRVVYTETWKDAKNDYGGATTSAGTAYLQSNSSIITTNETQIDTDINAANNETIATNGTSASKEQQVFFTLTMDKTDPLIPTAEICSMRGADGTNGAATIPDTFNGKIPGTDSFLVGGIHTHDKTNDPAKVNMPGTSTDDANAANSTTGKNVPIYAIDSYTGVTAGGNAIHKVDPSGNTSAAGTTSNQQIGKDVLKEYIKNKPNN